MDLFQDQIISQKMDFIKKSKNVNWLYEADLRVIDDADELREIVALALASTEPKSCDIETEGLQYKGGDKLVGVSFAFRNKDKITAVYVPLLSYIEQINLAPEKALSILKPLLEQPLVYFNGKFDIKWFQMLGLEPKIFADVSIMRFCVDTGLNDVDFNRTKNMSLKETYFDIFHENALNLEDVLGKGVYNFGFCPREGLKLYGASDSYITLRLYQYYSEKISKDNFIAKLENLILPIVSDMELEGIHVDSVILKEAKQRISLEQKDSENLIYQLANKKFNINSGQQLGSVLYDDLKLPCEKMTDTGEKATDKNSLERTLDRLNQLQIDNKLEKSPGQTIIETLFEYKKNEKLISSFIEPLMTQVDGVGKAHPTFFTYGAISGRFSAVNPPIQTLPKSDEGNSAILRRAFTSDSENYLLSADFQAMEMRIIGSVSKEETLKKSFLNNEDVHKNTASLIYNIPVKDVTKQQRGFAKTIGFGVAYGMSPFSLGKKLNITLEEAEKLHDLYFQKLPRVKYWIEETKKKICSSGVSVTHWGRKRLVPNAQLPVNWHDRSEEGRKIKSLVASAQREAINHVIQGSGADIVKISLCRLEKRLKGMPVKMVIQVHDQILFLVDNNIKPEEVIPIIRDGMELKIEGWVPLPVDISIGYNWGDLVDYKPGLQMDQIPFKSKVIISGDVMSKAEELKALFSEYTGENEVFMEVGGSLIQPETVIEDTGEVIPQTICASKLFIQKVTNLGLKVN